MLTKKPGIDNRYYYDKLLEMFEYLKWGYKNPQMPKTDVYDDLERALADYGLTEDDMKAGYRDDIDWEKVALRMYISVKTTHYNLYRYADEHTIAFEHGSMGIIESELERIIPIDVRVMIPGGTTTEEYHELVNKYC